MKNTYKRLPRFPNERILTLEKTGISLRGYKVRLFLYKRKNIDREWKLLDTITPTIVGIIKRNNYCNCLHIEFEDTRSFLIRRIYFFCKWHEEQEYKYEDYTYRYLIDFNKP